ncbi:MAG: DUF3617 family protein [Rhodocyclaceae bacterium]|jgi:hypothetical protein|nr:DUF3617 family protein [Rhodocyclaceae bacterium]MCA3022348.1 DUF3617 family protein [Rhodocyclaceae bacterium]MCA3025741.1 DUF3617 family protein [Rhodocyclaceae bacterium]MCA3028932.1 DUF3617 family protein [Rhodocyclaceae bacterium]MCA3031002.1 DUF3617 family protein [Rhodocyclaceae bacterium]
MPSMCTCTLVVGFVTMAIAAPTVAAQTPSVPMKPGLWEIVVKNETPGEDKKTTTTSRICFNADALRATEQILPQQGQFGARCAVKEFKYATGTATWTATCTSKTGTLSGPGTLSFKADDYSGTAQLSGKSGAKATKVNQTFAAKRLSACP